MGISETRVGAFIPIAYANGTDFIVLFIISLTLL
jgi:hypothetical protein